MMPLKLAMILMFPIPSPMRVPDTFTTFDECIEREVKNSQRRGYEADESEVTDWCAARTLQ